MSFESYRIGPGEAVDLAERETDTTAGWDEGKRIGIQRLRDLAQRLGELQERLYAGGARRLLVVLQGMDTAGKDSTIRDVFGGMNPQGIRVTPFTQPTPQELAHDFLWRVHPHVPGSGRVAVFNRSHYEDVLVVRVEGLVPEERWRLRYRHINEFERMLADEGTTLAKIFIHISREEQRRRLQVRLDQPDKRWKFQPGDLDTRQRWDEYQAAYAEAISLTSTEAAPWYVIPGDRKWYRKLVIAQLMVDLMETMDLRYPPPPDDLGSVVE